jgi:hypothetical protein
MVVSAQENAVGDVGAALISLPVFDVVGFAPGGRSFAAGPPASAIAGRESHALRPAEEPAFAPKIERLPSVVRVAVDGEKNCAGGARVPLDGGYRHGVGLALDEAAARTLVERVYYRVLTGEATQTMNVGDADGATTFFTNANVGTTGSTAVTAEGGKYYATGGDILLTVPSTKAWAGLKVEIVAVCTAFG